MNKLGNEVWNLPTDAEYQVWTAQLLRQKVGKDPKLDKYLVEDKQYCINSETLAVYQFQKQPLLGKYKSVIFDSREGIVLSHRSTSAHLTSFSRKNLLAGLEFQREFANRINLTSHNIIATGRFAYFSLSSYNTGNVDWVSLHQMIKFDISPCKAAVFKTVKNKPVSYIFAFFNCSPFIPGKINDGLYFNHALYELSTAHLEEKSGWKVKKTRGKSLVDQTDYFHPHPSLENINIKEIIIDLLDKKHARYGRYFAEYYELPQVPEDHKSIYPSSQRPDSLF